MARQAARREHHQDHSEHHPQVRQHQALPRSSVSPKEFYPFSGPSTTLLGKPEHFYSSQLKITSLVRLPYGIKELIKLDPEYVELYTEFPAKTTPSNILFTPYFKFKTRKSDFTTFGDIGAVFRYKEFGLSMNLQKTEASQVMLKTKIDYQDRIADGEVCFGSIDQYNLSETNMVRQKVGVSYQRGKYGIKLRTCRNGPEYGFPQQGYLALLYRSATFGGVAKASFEDQFSRMPTFSAVTTSFLGDNLIMWNEMVIPTGKSMTHFGYSYSKHLHFGLTLNFKAPTGTGFLNRPFSLSLQVRMND